MSGRYGGLCMGKKSKHSRVREHIVLAGLVIDLIVEIHNDLIPVLIDLFNMAFNSPSSPRLLTYEQC